MKTSKRNDHDDYDRDRYAFAERTPEWGPAIGECARLREKVAALRIELHLTESALREAWKRVPVTEMKKWRPCTFTSRNGNVCERPTVDRFGGKPQCKRHVAKGDVAVISILDELING